MPNFDTIASSRVESSINRKEKHSVDNLVVCLGVILFRVSFKIWCRFRRCPELLLGLDSLRRTPLHLLPGSRAEILPLEFTHFLNENEHFTPINKG